MFDYSEGLGIVGYIQLRRIIGVECLIHFVIGVKVFYFVAVAVIGRLNTFRRNNDTLLAEYKFSLKAVEYYIYLP